MQNKLIKVHPVVSTRKPFELDIAFTHDLSD